MKANENHSSDSGGEVIAVGSGSDSDDCVIEQEESKAKGTGFYQKQQLK